MDGVGRGGNLAQVGEVDVAVSCGGFPQSRPGRRKAGMLWE